MAEFLSAAEAARQLGVSRQTLYSYVSRGLLRAHETSDPRQRRADAVAANHRGRENPDPRASLDFAGARADRRDEACARFGHQEVVPRT